MKNKFAYIFAVSLFAFLMIFSLANAEIKAEPGSSYTWSDCKKDGGSDAYCGQFPGAPANSYTWDSCKKDGGSDAYCSQFSGAPVSSENLGEMSSGSCTKNSDCGTGFKCFQQSCVDEQTYSDNVAWYTKAAKSVGDFFGGDFTPTSNPASSIVGTIPQATVINGVNIPAGAEVHTDGSVWFNGTKLLPAGSVPSTILTSGGSSNTGSDVAPCNGDPNFQSIGGVCFPVNTGLSSAPIESILGNIFLWLMGLFTTLAIIAFVISGIQYFIAAGDPKMMETAKKNAIYAVIGIIVGLSGFVIINAIKAALSGQSILF